MGGHAQLTGPDLAAGVTFANLADGGLVGGHAHGKAVVLCRRGDEVFALDGTCTHYGAPLADGIVTGDTLRCPWHHACFDLRTGAALKAPALRPLGRWEVEVRDGVARVIRELGVTAHPHDPAIDSAARGRAVVIVGAGPAGDAAADMLRRQGHTGSIVLIGGEETSVVDRPNLSKDYLAGNAPEEWIPLRPDAFYEEIGVTQILGDRVASIQRATKQVALSSGRTIPYDVLLLATGASPIRLPSTVDADGRALYLRTLADSRRIIEALATAKGAVVIGASFIGLEVAASLRTRGLSVHVVAPEAHPLERVMGRDLSAFIRALHESKGVEFHLGRTVASVDASGVTLDDGGRLDCDLLVAGIGVRPNEELARDAELPVDRGIVVDEYLATADPSIFAAGDVARHPDFVSGAPARIEHWVVAQRQGQAAALNMLGARRPYRDVPFFWSAHYDATIAYVGHAEQFDSATMDGSADARDCRVRFSFREKDLAVATIGRDREALEAEVEFERRG